MKNNFNDFTGLSPVQKTICMELVPSTITKKHISITGNENDIFHNDFMRNEKYNDIKKVMDDFYRDFISKNLTRVPDIDWNILFDLYAQKADKKIIDEKETELAALIMDSFDPVDKKAVIFSAKFISTILPEFIQSNNGYTEEDKECYLTRCQKLIPDLMVDLKNILTQSLQCLIRSGKGLLRKMLQFFMRIW